MKNLFNETSEIGLLQKCSYIDDIGNDTVVQTHTKNKDDLFHESDEIALAQKILFIDYIEDDTGATTNNNNMEFLFNNTDDVRLVQKPSFTACGAVGLNGSTTNVVTINIDPGVGFTLMHTYPLPLKLRRPVRTMMRPRRPRSASGQALQVIGVFFFYVKMRVIIKREWLGEMDRIAVDILLETTYTARCIQDILTAKRWIVPVQSKPVLITSVMKEEEHAQWIDAVSMEQECKHSMNKDLVLYSNWLFYLTCQTSDRPGIFWDCSTGHLQKWSYKVCGHASKANETIVGSSLNRNCQIQAKQSLLCLRLNLRREIDASAKEHDCRTGNPCHSRAGDRK